MSNLCSAINPSKCTLTVVNSLDAKILINIYKKGYVKCGQVWWPILGICALHLSYPKCTHSAVNTHPEQWVDIAAAPGEQLGVRCLAQGSHLSRGIEGGENAHRSLPPPDNSCQTRDLNPQPQVTSPTLYPLGHDCPGADFGLWFNLGTIAFPCELHGDCIHQIPPKKAQKGFFSAFCIV